MHNSAYILYIIMYDFVYVTYNNYTAYLLYTVPLASGVYIGE